MSYISGKYDRESALGTLVNSPTEVSLRGSLGATETSDPNEETYHVQADGFWGFEKGFHDVEELWRQRQKQD